MPPSRPSYWWEWASAAGGRRLRQSPARVTVERTRASIPRRVALTATAATQAAAIARAALASATHGTPQATRAAELPRRSACDGGGDAASRRLDQMRVIEQHDDRAEGNPHGDANGAASPQRVAPVSSITRLPGCRSLEDRSPHPSCGCASFHQDVDELVTPLEPVQHTATERDSARRSPSARAWS